MTVAAAPKRGPALQGCFGLRALWCNGAVLIAVAALLFSLSTLNVKEIALRGKIDVVLVLLFSSTCSLVGCSVAVAVSGARLWSASRPVALLTVARAGLGCTTIALYYQSMTYLSMRDAVTLFFASPVIAAALEWLVFPAGAVGAASVVGVGFSVLGVVLVAQPDCIHSQVHAVGMAMAVGAAMTNATAFIVLRLIGATKSVSQPAVVLTWWYSAVLLCSSLGTLAMRHQLTSLAVPGREDLLLLCGVSSTQLVAQVLLNRGFQLESPTRGAAVNVLQVVFSYALDLFVIRDSLNHMALAGAGCVVAGVLVVALGGSSTPPAAAAGQRLSFERLPTSEQDVPGDDEERASGDLRVSVLGPGAGLGPDLDFGARKQQRKAGPPRRQGGDSGDGSGGELTMPLISGASSSAPSLRASLEGGPHAGAQR